MFSFNIACFISVFILSVFSLVVVKDESNADKKDELGYVLEMQQHIKISAQNCYLVLMANIKIIMIIFFCPHYISSPRDIIISRDLYL